MDCRESPAGCECPGPLEADRKDPSGFKIEHYADGDIVNDKTPTSRQAAGPDTLSIWGPPLPVEFVEAS